MSHGPVSHVPRIETQDFEVEPPNHLNFQIVKSGVPKLCQDFGIIVFSKTIDFQSCHWYMLFLMFLKITIFAADQWPFFALDKTHTLQKFEGRALRFWIFRTAQIGRLNFYEHGWYFAFRWISKTLILAGTWCIFWVAITVLNFYKTKDWNDRLQKLSLV